MKQKLILAGLLAGSAALTSMAQTDALRFNPDNYIRQSLTMPDGREVSYKAYEGIYYVTNIEDSVYQTLNLNH